jgi:phosphoribosylformimino-5-aminoimidazole carboxamide ribotide isomerase
MRIIPVLDLMGGVAVHARRGERAAYRPVRSLLAPDTADPLMLCRALSAAGFTEAYIADLDAISRTGSHIRQLSEIAAKTGLRLMVDAGLQRAADLTPIFDGGITRAVVGTETLAGLDELTAMLDLAGPGRIVFSLDLRAGQVLSPDPQLAAQAPLAVLAAAARAGVTQAVAIDLARVGAGTGPDLALAAAAAHAVPLLEFLAGGGVRDGSDLEALQQAGAAGALVATCLHTGALSVAEARKWM